MIHVVKKQWSGICQTVCPIQYAAVAGKDAAGILDAEIAFDRRDGKVAQKPGDADQ